MLRHAFRCRASGEDEGNSHHAEDGQAVGGCSASGFGDAGCGAQQGQSAGLQGELLLFRAESEQAALDL